MSPELLRRVLREAIDQGVKEVIPSTMGEPLLYEHFDIFIDELKGSSTKLNLTTNGSFPKKGADKWAYEIFPLASDVKISLNGINPEINDSIMIGTNTKEAISNVLRFATVRNNIRMRNINDPTVTLQVTFIKKNLHDLENIIKFAIENGIDRVKGHHLWITWPELKSQDLRKGTNREQWNRFVDKVEKYRNKIKLENFTEIPDTESTKDTVPETYECPFLGNETWIAHDGTFNVCCAPSREREKLGNFGNINDNRLIQLFNTENYRDLVQEYKSREVCRTCPLRK